MVGEQKNVCFFGWQRPLKRPLREHTYNKRDTKAHFLKFKGLSAHMDAHKCYSTVTCKVLLNRPQRY